MVELSSSTTKSDLLLASINQKSKELTNINFNSAINYRESLRLAKYLIFPVLIMFFLWIGGFVTDFIDSYNRIKNYDLAYAPPAPFSFILENKKLNFLEGEEVQIRLSTKGDVKPSQVYLVYEGNRYLMARTTNFFVHTVSKPVSGSFYFEAEGFSSSDFDLVIGSVPKIESFKMRMVYPEYLKKESLIVTGTGNMEVPEGTLIKWMVNTKNTDSIVYSDNDTITFFNKNKDSFVFQKRFYKNSDYQVSTSNVNTINYESLAYTVKTIKDKFPTIDVTEERDTLTFNSLLFKGVVSDDYLVKEIALWYYPVNNSSAKKKKVLSTINSNVGVFNYEFPSGLDIEKGGEYELYFEVKDNDGIHGGKVSRSRVFKSSLYDNKELKEIELDAYKSSVQQWDKQISKSEDQNKILKEINQNQNQSESLEFGDKQKIKKFVQDQKRQEELMKKFSNNLKKQIEKNEEVNEFNRLLKERLERQELEAEKNKKLLDELNTIADKLDKEELKSKLEDLAKKQNSGKRNLEQLLELTKRYYVTEKASQLSRKLQDLSKKQDTLSRVEDVLRNEETKKTQRKLNEDFNKLSEELDELDKENSKLKKPLDIDVKSELQKDIKVDQSDILEEIGKENGSVDEGSEATDEKQVDTSKKMKNIAQKMKQLSEGLKQAASMGGGSSVAEDAEMLRQILDNLITFSFQQEELFDKVSSSALVENETSLIVKEQQNLKELFGHVDDSLFALSLRQPDLSEFVNDEISEVYYNIEKALDNITENQVFQGASYQQYVLNASNSLADYLAKLLDNMQQSMMSGNGSGNGNQDGFQLPDIIKAQQKLGEKAGNSSGGVKDGAQGNKKGKDGLQGQQGDRENEKSKMQGSAETESIEGKNGSSKSGKGYGSEEGLKELYEIYKEQQEIRSKLEEQLENFINSKDKNLAKKLVQQMESFEEDLLENGITKNAINKINTIQSQLLRLENASLKQGKQIKRESRTNDVYFNGSSNLDIVPNAKGSPVIEILDRQALPLQENLQIKVKGYFEKQD